MFFVTQVYENGLSDGEFIFYFNLREAARGIENKAQLLQRVGSAVLSSVSFGATGITSMANL